ncbi:hypothetical protein [Shewanella frigidimarina]|uniref:hypothetical protein n=1 Tax=Shewanella frigidimarina TaxID=56812 RepID=UPI003D7AC29C
MAGGEKTSSNYMNLLDIRNMPWAISAYELAKSLPQGQLKELTQKQALLVAIGRVVPLVELHFTNNRTLYLTSNGSDLVFEGKWYRADAMLQSLTAPKQTPEINNDGFSVTISAINTEIQEIIEQKGAQNCLVVIRGGVIDDKGEVAACFEYSTGYINNAKLTLDTKAGKLEVTFEADSINANLDKIPGNRPAQAVHKARFPNDNFFKYTGVKNPEEWSHR